MGMIVAEEKKLDEFYQNPDPIAGTGQQRQNLIYKLSYLVTQVDDKYNNKLIKSKIGQRKYIGFDRARALVDDNKYYQSFFNELDLNQLEDLLLFLRPGLEVNIRSSANIKQVFNHVYNNQLAANVHEDEDRQYILANKTNQWRPLEEEELNKCGRPFAEIFANNINLLPNDEQEYSGNFNKIIRTLLLDPKMPTLHLQQKLLYTACWLAIALKNAGLDSHADKVNKEINYVKKGSGSKVKNVSQSNNYFTSFMSYYFSFISRFFSLDNRNKENSTKPEPNPTKPPAHMSINNVNATMQSNNLSQKAHNLSQLYSEIYSKNSRENGISVEGFTGKQSSLTFNYDKNKQSKVESIAKSSVTSRVFQKAKL